jgi:Starch-binding associating with outer membrane
MMNRNILVLLLLLFSAVSCRKDFNEINTNPFNPTQTSMEALFNGVLASLPLSWNEQFYMHNETLYELTQQGALISHAWPNIRIGVDEVWDNYYTTLRNIRALEERFDQYDGSQEELDNVRAMLKIVTAYKTFKVTDLFGDMPFFDAGRGGQSNEFLRPQYDRQEAIYKHLLSELEWAVAHIHLEPNTPAGKPYYSFRQFDTVLKSDLSRWRRWANSMRLRHAMRMVEKDPDFAGKIIKTVFDNLRAITGRSMNIRVCGWALRSGIKWRCTILSTAAVLSTRVHLCFLNPIIRTNGVLSRIIPV